jgi:hypothetical protein
MKLFYFLSKWNGISTSLALGGAIFLSCPIHAQNNVSNTRPTLDLISDYTTSFSTDIRYIELTGITPGEEIDQQVTIDVSTEDKDLIRAISADLVDNGKAFINYQLKQGAVGTATVKVVVTDNGPTPSTVTRTFHIMIDALNRELITKSSEEGAIHHLKAIPNPALVSSRIFFSTPQDEKLVAVDLYTISGAKIKQLFTGSTMAHRSYFVDVNSKNLATGVYIVQLTSESHKSNLKLVVAK